MLSEKTKHIQDFAGHEKQSYINFENSNGTLRKKYVLEYCDDTKKLDRLGLLVEDGGLEIDDVYHRITWEETIGATDAFDGIAHATYLSYLFRSDICDVKLWERIFDGEEMIQERWFEYPSTYVSTLRHLIDRDTKEERDKLRREIDELKTANEQMQKFIGHYKLDKVLSDFKTA